MGEQIHRYSQIRLWGSIGFIGAAIGAGLLVDDWGIGMVPALLCGVVCRVVAEQPAGAGTGPRQMVQESPPLGSVLRRPAVIAFHRLFSQSRPPTDRTTGFSLYLETIGYSRESIGLLWGLGVAAEVGLFLAMHRLLPRFGAAPLAVDGVGAGGVYAGC